MKPKLVYTPILRLRQEEKKILTNFNFGTHIYPYVEIIKEIDRLPVTVRKGKKVIPKNIKTFEDVYLDTLSKINCAKIFVDLPVHLKENKKMANEVISFLRQVVSNRNKRTEYLIKLSSLSEKIIPVISTYYQRTGEANSIVNQEKDLRKKFSNLAYRTFPETFSNDMIQIERIAQSEDFLIVDLNKYSADPENEDVKPIIEKLKSFSGCKVIIARSAISEKTTNVGLEHGKIIADADNSLLENYKELYGTGFADYAGIKKDALEDGGSVSPGLVYFDPTQNVYFGFKGRPRETIPEKFCEYEETIVPAVLACGATKRMKSSGLPYLTDRNGGWKTINNISDGIESGKSAAKFKAISMNHYLHCLRTLIESGDLN